MRRVQESTCHRGSAKIELLSGVCDALPFCWAARCLARAHSFAARCASGAINNECVRMCDSDTRQIRAGKGKGWLVRGGGEGGERSGDVKARAGR